MTRKTLLPVTPKGYEAPLCVIVEIMTEGVLCESGSAATFEHDGIVGDDSSIF